MSATISMLLLSDTLFRVELRCLVTHAKRTNDGWERITSKRQHVGEKLRKFCAMMKSQSRELFELVGQDDEEQDREEEATGVWIGEEETVRSTVADIQTTNTEAGDETETADDLEDSDDLDEDAVENRTVWLPSSFTSEVVNKIPALQKLVQRERQLRRAHCDRLKRELNLSLRVFGVMVRDTKRLGLTTRSRATIERQKRTQKRLVKSYQRHQAALEQLGMSTEDHDRYPSLTWEQLIQHRPTNSDKPREIGSGRSQKRGPLLPWLTMDVSSFEPGDEGSKAELIRELSTDGV